MSIFAALMMFQTIGCTAVVASVRMQSASSAIEETSQSGALKVAPYEHTMAQEYLRMAKEEASIAEYQSSVSCADKSLEWTKATAKKIKRNKKRLEQEKLSNELQQEEGIE